MVHTMPQVLLQASEKASRNADDNVLVVVQLSGGNDGLNTIVPWSDDDYYKNRYSLGIGRNSVLKIDDQLGFHPAARGLADLLEDGKLAIVHSHFGYLSGMFEEGDSRLYVGRGAGLTLLPGASCTITLSVGVPDAPLASAPPFVNTTTGVTGKVGALDVSGAPASDELSINSLALSKSFDGPAVVGGTAVLTFTLENLSATETVTDLAFTDNLDTVISGLEATGLPAGPVCDTGTVSGDAIVFLTGATLDPQGMCTFDVTVEIPIDEHRARGVVAHVTVEVHLLGIDAVARSSQLQQRPSGTVVARDEHIVVLNNRGRNVGRPVCHLRVAPEQLAVFGA